MSEQIMKCKNYALYKMSTIFPLYQTVAMVTARYLLDHDDNNSEECRNQAQAILRQLKSNLYTAISKDVLQEFVTKFPKELTGELLSALAPPHLKTLELKKCQKILDEAVQDPQCLNVVLQRCRRLQTLNMDECDLHTSIELCLEITQNAPSLSSISLENCLGVNDGMVQVFLIGFPGLQHLNLSLLPQITDRVFALGKEQDSFIASSRPGSNLTSVELGGCRQLSSTCIRYLTELCGPSLQSLNVANTGMDCTILWYLSGYSLTTAGQLAILANKNLTGEDSMQGVQLAELLKDLKNLQQKIKEKVQAKEECSTEIESVIVDEQCLEAQDQIDFNQNVSRESVNVDVSKIGNDGYGTASCIGFQEFNDIHRHDKENVEKSIQVSNSSTQQMHGEFYQCYHDPNFASAGSNQLAIRNGDDQNQIGNKEHTDGENGRPDVANMKRTNPCSLGDGMNDYLVKQSTCSTNSQPIGAHSHLHEQYSPDERTSNSMQDHTEYNSNCNISMDTRTKVNKFVNNILTMSINILQSEQNVCDQNVCEQTTSSAINDLKNGEGFKAKFDVDNNCPVGGICEKDGVVSDDSSVCIDSIDTFVQSILARSVNALENEPSTCHQSGVIRSSENHCACPTKPPTVDLAIKTEDSEGDRMDNIGEDIKCTEIDDISLHILSNTDLNNKGHVKSVETQLLTASIEDNQGDGSSKQQSRKLVPEPRKTTPFSEGVVDNNCNHIKSDVHKESSSQNTKRTIGTTADQTSTSLGLHRQYTPAICSLDISNINFDEVLAKTCLEEFFGANKGLKKLVLAWNQLQDSLLEIIATASSELQYLALYDSESITSPGLAQLLTYCPKLQRLELQGACFISDFGLSPLFMRAERSGVTSLQLSETNVTNTSLEYIAKYLGSKLTSLELSWCEDISEDGLAAISTKCTSLKTFHARQGKMSADSLIKITQNCLGLTCLNLSSVDCLTDDVIIEMACNLRLMKDLDISWNSALTDSAVSAVMCNCPQLIELNIAGLKNTTEKPLLPIVADFDRWRRCLALIKIKARERRVLRVSGDLQYSSDEEYEDLFVPVRSTSYVPNLKYIDVEYCDRMKDKVLAQIVAICRGTLTIKDYYGEGIVPKLLPNGL